ncbi:MAG TPA: xanthine dehydrogenase family protein molybdopterin-binding subunit, partial [Dehalococcoidia bacterium]|nr:xanthine dehydrogenase family protein molybdopterin-binding subunit [Dehalococcoidia bacterium]
MASFNAVGKRVPRIEGVAKVTGETKYSGDIQLRGLLHAKVLRSSLAHARIKRIDLSRARALPGVFGVYTQKDLVAGLHVDPSSRALTLLASDEILYYGQPLVVALASEASLAEEALA